MLPVIAVTALAIATGSAVAQQQGGSKAALRDKCRALAQQNSPGREPTNVKRRFALFRLCMQQGGKL
jgi:hypothetical protein